MANQLASGRWLARRDETGKRVQRIFATREAAEAWEDEKS